MEKLQARAFLYRGVTLLFVKWSFPAFDEGEEIPKERYQNLLSTALKTAEESVFEKLSQKYEENPNPKKRFTTRPKTLLFTVERREKCVYSVSLVYKTARECRILFSFVDRWNGDLSYILPPKKERKRRALPFLKLIHFPPKKHQ